MSNPWEPVQFEAVDPDTGEVINRGTCSRHVWEETVSKFAGHTLVAADPQLTLPLETEDAA